MFVRWFPRFLLFCIAALASSPPTVGQAATLEDFFGAYKGVSVTKGPIGFEARYLDLVIKEKEKGEKKEGFIIEWETGIPRADGTYKYKSFKIHFLPTQRDNVYRSAMRRDMFGNQVPLDPLKGEPFFWSTLKGDQLTVYGIIINEDGSYELQAYERTLTEKGLDLRFYRVREGERTQVVDGSLKRTGD